MNILIEACNINVSSAQNFSCFTTPVSTQLCNTHCKPLYLVSPVLPKEYFEGCTNNHIVLNTKKNYSVE